MSKLNLDTLKSHLWESANILRGSIDAADYKNYIFGLLFLKRLSDVFEEEAERIEKETGNKKLAWNDPDEHEFFVPKTAIWEYIKSHTQNLGEILNKANDALEERNTSSLEGVLTVTDFNDKDRLPDVILSKLIAHFSKIRLRNEDLSEPDILGRAYEYLIGQFADDAGKKGGEFYTPFGVVRLLVRILNPQEGMRICDPACGSGGMLIECVNYLKEQGKNPKNISIYGQEKNLNTWAIAKMNILLHNILDSKIEHGDTMADPKLVEDNRLMLFDIVIANPMWNQKEWSRELFEKGDPYGRAKYGIPSKSSGDWMWIQHMLSTLNSRGRLGVVLDNGALFRGQSEGAVRKAIIEADLIEGVVALPPNLFYNTGAPGCLIIINKKKPEQLKKKIFFIHAENEFEEGKAQNFLRNTHIQKISQTYQKREEIEKFSALIDLEEIQENDYNLNLSRYIDILAKEESIDVSEFLKKLKEIFDKRLELETQFKKNMEELGYE